MTYSWFPWLRSGSGPQRAARTRRASKPRRSFVPHFMVLEDRTVLSTLTVLSSADSGAGSLRDTLAAAQSGDTIVFDPSLMHDTITLTSGPLAIGSNITIDGPGTNLLAISGNQNSRILELTGSAQVTVADLTLTGGLSSQGGAILTGGTAALTLDSDILSGNQAVGDTNGNALGGAVYNSAGASLTIDHTVFMNNQTNGTNESFGGAIANAGSLAINGASFIGNAALGSTSGPDESPPGGSQGGAIGNLDGSTATIMGTTFAGNQALGTSTGNATGGAICNVAAYVFPFTGSGVTITVSQCTFENNTAKGGSNAADGGFGGAIEDQPGVYLAVLDCSFIGNQADSGGGTGGGGDMGARGGAIDDQPAVTATISNSQFINNSAIGSGVGSDANGGAVANFDAMMIASCLFEGNTALGGAMADGMNTIGAAQGGAIFTGLGIPDHLKVILTLANSIVAGNEAIGGSGGSTLAFTRTGAAFGGGIINNDGGTLNIVGCTITGNQAKGGASAQGNGAPALGGGVQNLIGTLNVTDSTVSTNLCQGGQGATDAAGGLATGGGIGNDRGSIAIITNSTISLNQSIGGVGGAGANGGAAVGGGITNAVFKFAFGGTDASSLTLSNCQIVGNTAQGGTAGSSAQGGDGLGGGLFLGSGTAMLEAVLVSGSQSKGGADSQQNITGNGLGGGVYVDPNATAIANTETLITGNQASKDNNDVWGTITIVP